MRFYVHVKQPVQQYNQKPYQTFRKLNVNLAKILEKNERTQENPNE